MDFFLLGALAIDGMEVSQMLSAPKPRSVLAMLMLSPNRAVSTAALIQELWQDRPPRSALTTLQTYILQLRRMLRRVSASNSDRPDLEVLVTRLPGYLLRTDNGFHDLTRYEQLVTEGQRSRADGDFCGARDAFGQALALWRGEPLSDVRPGPLLELHVRRLEQSRLVTTELRIEADLQLGRHHEVLSELTSLVGNHSMHEGFRAQYMTALSRSGRTQDALHSYHSFRSTMVGELGLEPSDKLQELHRAILSGDQVGHFYATAGAGGRY